VVTNWFGVSNIALPGEVPLSLTLSFIIGALVLLTTILITVFTTKEYTPEEMALINDYAKDDESDEKAGLMNIFTDFRNMPKTMRQLSWVQFFSWFGLFGMWVFTTPAIAHHVYGLALDDHESKTYQDAGDWVGIIFGVYNAVSAVYAFFLPYIAKKLGRKRTHAISLIIGGIGLISIYFAQSPYWLLASMIAVGISWASILAMPYAILAGSIPPKKMGIYMGIFNFFIVIPQIINALIGGPMVKYLYGGNPIWALVVSGFSFLIAASLVYKVDDVDDTVIQKL
jgi:maltose/moltooligosaccharide transporter